MRSLGASLYGVTIMESDFVPKFNRIRGKKAHFKLREFQRITGRRIAGIVRVGGIWYIKRRKVGES